MRVRTRRASERLLFPRLECEAGQRENHGECRAMCGLSIPFCEHLYHSIPTLVTKRLRHWDLDTVESWDHEMYENSTMYTVQIKSGFIPFFDLLTLVPETFLLERSNFTCSKLFSFIITDLHWFLQPSSNMMKHHPSPHDTKRKRAYRGYECFKTHSFPLAHLLDFTIV